MYENSRRAPIGDGAGQQFRNSAGFERPGRIQGLDLAAVGGKDDVRRRVSRQRAIGRPLFVLDAKPREE